METKIYFDNGSTSWPKAPGVAEAMAKLLTEGAFNINRGNSRTIISIESVNKAAALIIKNNRTASAKHVTLTSEKHDTREEHENG